MKKLTGYIIIIIAIVFYLCYPEKYNYLYIVFGGIIYLFFTYLYYKTEKKKNYFDFDGIFILVYFIATLYFPLFLHNTALVSRYFVFLYGYDDNVLPQGAGLAVMGLGSYLSGSLLFVQKNNMKDQMPQRLISNKLLYILSLFSFIAYIIFGGYQRTIDLYAGKENIAAEVGIASYLFILCPALLIVGIIIEFVNIRRTHKRFKISFFSKLGIFVISFIVIAMLLTGSRTFPMQIILVILGLYTYLFRSFGLLKFAIYLALGIMILFGVVVLRSSLGGESFVGSDILSDIFGVVRAIYSAIEYTDKYGFTYGETMLSPVLAPIPFAQNFFVTALGFDPQMMSSSLLYTKYTLGKVGNLGLGTNIVADLFFSFGGIGVFFCLFLLGRFIKKNSVYGRYNIYALTAYGVMMSYAVFLVRAEFFFFLRFLLWSLCIMFLTIRFKRVL